MVDFVGVNEIIGTPEMLEALAAHLQQPLSIGISASIRIVERVPGTCPEWSHLKPAR
jgi:hypothetical protein